jgi:transposase-like protein
MGVQGLVKSLEEELTTILGERYRHLSNREGSRWGSTQSSVTLGGRKISIDRPRGRWRKGGEVELPTLTAVASEDPLSEHVVRQLLAGVSTRGYHKALEPVPEDLSVSATSKSAASRRFVARTEGEMKSFLSRSLSLLDLVALMIDGFVVAGSSVICALGIDHAGCKHVLGLWEGATENATVVRELLTNLVERGLNADATLLFVIDGGKALRKAIREVFGERAKVQRCQVHKLRNVLDHLPESWHPLVRQALRAAFRAPDAAKGRQLVKALAGRLETDHPGAAASLREGLDELLTVAELGVQGWLRRTLETTNPIENLVSTVRWVSRKVKRWRSGSMVLRWAATGVVEAEKRFRRVKGYRDLGALAAALRSPTKQLVKSA